MLTFRIDDQFARVRGSDLWPLGRQYMTLERVRILWLDVPVGTKWDGGTGVMMRDDSPLAWLFLWHDLLDRWRWGWVLLTDALFLALWALVAIWTALRGVVRLDAADILRGVWACGGWCVYAPAFVVLYPTRLFHRYTDEAWVRWSALACNSAIVGLHGMLLAPWP